MLKRFYRKFAPNPLDRLLRKAQKRQSRRFLIGWNRGLGDIALGLYAIIHRIREFIPDASITFLTRENLREGFSLLQGVNILIDPQLKRGVPIDVKGALKKLSVETNAFDEIIENPDPTYWVKWQIGKLVPLLHWNAEWDPLWERFGLEKGATYIGAHVQTETNYATWRNWPQAYWEELFVRITEKHNAKVLLFGYETNSSFSMKNVIDLRGKTKLLELLSIIKHCCAAIVVPDSGISSMTYFLNERFPIKVISLWADPNMGILKQNVASPNPFLKHVPLIGPEKNIAKIQVQDVERALFL